MSICEEIAAELDGEQYPLQISNVTIERAKQDGVVIVYGASDDLMEFEGAISDEVGAYGGVTASLTRNGLLTNDCEDEDCPHFAKLIEYAATIEAEEDNDGYSWTYKTDIPHETFEVVDDGEKYCRGIVFRLADIEPRKAP